MTTKRPTRKAVKHAPRKALETRAATTAGQETAPIATLRIELPLPLKDCSPNAHVHWRKVAAAQKVSRRDACTLGSQAIPKGYVQVPVRISTEWFMGPSNFERQSGKRIYYRPRDIQNAESALKGAIDGLVDAGLVPDDNDEWVRWGDCVLHRAEKDHKGRCCVVVTVEALP